MRKLIALGAGVLLGAAASVVLSSCIVEDCSVNPWPPVDGVYIVDANVLADCMGKHVSCLPEDRIEVSGQGTILVETYTALGTSYRVEYHPE